MSYHCKRMIWRLICEPYLMLAYMRSFFSSPSLSFLMLSLFSLEKISLFFFVLSYVLFYILLSFSLSFSVYISFHLRGPANDASDRAWLAALCRLAYRSRRDRRRTTRYRGPDPSPAPPRSRELGPAPAAHRAPAAHIFGPPSTSKCSVLNFPTSLLWIANRRAAQVRPFQL